MVWSGLVKGAKEWAGKVRDPHPPLERLLYAFSTPEDLARWTLYSDAEYGGATTASLAASAEFPGTAEFAGVCAGTSGRGRHTPPADASTSAPSQPPPPPPPSPTRRGGFAGISAVEATGYLDLSPYDTLTLRVRGDGRPYIASLRTENWLVGGRSHDVWQAFLLAPAGEWATVSLPLSRFLLTHRGRLVEARVEMNAARVISFGLGLANAGAGGSGGAVVGGGTPSPPPPATIPPAPFRLGLDWVRAESRTRGVRRRADQS